jgi:hypothetical protein
MRKKNIIGVNEFYLIIGVQMMCLTLNLASENRLEIEFFFLIEMNFEIFERLKIVLKLDMG